MAAVLDRTNYSGAGQDSGTAGPSGAREPNPFRRAAVATRGAGRVESTEPLCGRRVRAGCRGDAANAADPYRGGEARHPAAPAGRAGANQGGSVAALPHPAGRNGSVQRVSEFQAERRRGLPRGRGGAGRGTFRRHGAANGGGAGVQRTGYRMGRKGARIRLYGLLRRGQ